jgi:hypothetical protein
VIKIIYTSLQEKNITKEDLEDAKKLILELEKPYQDVELMIVKSLSLLIDYCNSAK